MNTHLFNHDFTQSSFQQRGDLGTPMVYVCVRDPRLTCVSAERAGWSLSKSKMQKAKKEKKNGCTLMSLETVVQGR